MVKFLYFPALLSCLGGGGATWAEGRPARVVSPRRGLWKGIQGLREFSSSVTMEHCIDAIGREYLTVTEAKKCEKAEGTAEMAMV